VSRRKSSWRFFCCYIKIAKPLLNTLDAYGVSFLLAVFATMYLNDVQRGDFYATIGLDSRQFDKHVIRKTNQSASTVFPVILDVDRPEFF
jgi:magnesium-protoporphyrin IX monomethyl ester (oxidative) cyclase